MKTLTIKEPWASLIIEEYKSKLPLNNALTPPTNNGKNK